MGSEFILVDVAEIRREIIRPDEDDTPLITETLVQCSEEVERVLRRKIISRGTITEYHTMRQGIGATLQLSQWPVISITSVHEDSNRVYGSATELVAGTDYQVDNDTGILTRIRSGAATRWSTAYEAVKVVWIGGYAAAIDVPGTIKSVTKQFFAQKFREVTEQRVGTTQVSDGFGNRSYMPAELTAHQIGRLGGHKKWFPTTTLTRKSVA